MVRETQRLLRSELLKCDNKFGSYNTCILLLHIFFKYFSIYACITLYDIATETWLNITSIFTNGFDFTIDRQ